MKRLLFAVLLLLLPLLAFGQQTIREYVLQNSGVVRTTSGIGADVDTGADSVNYHHSTGFVGIEVSAVSGTSPTLVVGVECRTAVASRYAPIAVTATISTVSNVGLQLPHVCRTVRLSWTITGTTPSFTFGAWLHRQ